MSPNTNTANPNLIIPKWINEEYFIAILQQDVPNFERIVDFKTIAATAPGENFTSTMVRVEIEVELKDKQTQTVSYILKTSHQNEVSASFIKALQLFPREKQMYQVLLKRFEELYREAGRDVKLGPKCLHVEETPEHITLVLEDLRRQNFANVDRLQGMDLAHTSCALRKLAELHAASAVYYERNGPYDEMFMVSFYTESNRAMFEHMAASRQDIVVRAMRDWDLENVEMFVKELSDPKKVFDEGLRMNNVDPNEFNVLNHGDCWTNNFMFKHGENGEIEDALMVDFQVGKWGTPAQDLWYFIVSSTSYDVRTKEFDRLLYIYHQHLKECLQALKYPKPIPTLKDLHIMMLKYGYWAILTAAGVLTVVLYPSNDDAKIENLLESGAEADEFKYKVLANPLYERACCQTYRFLQHRGIFKFQSEDV